MAHPYWIERKKTVNKPYTGYTGIKDSGAAIEMLVDLCKRRWKAESLGTYADRDKRGKPGQKSVHADYRAADIDFPTLEAKKKACATLAGLYGVELIIDYAYRGPLRNAFGRAWRCDRARWRNLKRGEVSGGGQSWANFIHVEVAPGTDPERLEKAFRATPK